jgi:hypothetical protein
MLALARSAEAKIVYTTTHVVIDRVGHYNLQLNHSNITDFRIGIISSPHCADSCFQLLYVKPATGSGQQVGYFGKSFTHEPFATPMKQGSVIAPKAFLNSPVGADVMREVYSTLPAKGPWYFVTNRYLGLKFKIGGKTHYGWARLNVGGFGSLVATITGYAYETIPNKPIVAGRTHGPDVIVRHGTLGELAAGRK